MTADQLRRAIAAAVHNRPSTLNRARITITEADVIAARLVDELTSGGYLPATGSPGPGYPEAQQRTTEALRRSPGRRL